MVWFHKETNLSTGVLMVTSNNKPISDIVNHKKEAILFDKDPDKYNYIRKNGRDLILEKYDLHKVSIPEYEKIIRNLINLILLIIFYFVYIITMIDQISDNLYWIILLIIPILLYINYYSKPTKKKD
jgi:hypothetical protein